MKIETRKKPLSWTLYLMMVCVFQNNENSKKMMESFELLDKDFIREKKMMSQMNKSRE